MFIVIRLIIVFIGLIIPVLVYRFSTKIRNKRVLIFFMALALTVSSLCGAIPFENAFVTFDTPESVCVYQFNEHPLYCAEGENSALFFYSQNQSLYYSGTIKKNGGWKMIMGGNVNSQYQRIDNSVSIYIYQIGNIDDMYIKIQNWGDKSILDLADSRGTTFTRVSLLKNEEVFCAYIGKTDPLYCVTVNGNTIYPFIRTNHSK